MRVLTSSMGWVKLTAKQAATPPQAMDSMRVGLRTVASTMVQCYFSGVDFMVGSDSAGSGSARWSEEEDLLHEDFGRA